MSSILNIRSATICGRYKKAESATVRYEKQMIFASWLYMHSIIEVDGEHLSVKVSEPPIYPGQDQIEQVLTAMRTAGTVVEAAQHASCMNPLLATD